MSAPAIFLTQQDKRRLLRTGRLATLPRAVPASNKMRWARFAPSLTRRRQSFCPPYGSKPGHLERVVLAIDDLGCAKLLG